MSTRIEDYALIGDCQTAALISREGSIDWLCLPRFDSSACFAALLGTPDHGRWLLVPAGKVTTLRRRYRQDTLILETDFETHGGAVRVVDCMQIRSANPVLVRRVIGLVGQVQMRTEIVLRFDYGSIVPWVRRVNGGIVAVAGPEVVHLTSDVQLHGEHFKTVSDFTVSVGETLSFVLTWYPSHQQSPPAVDPANVVQETECWWREWSNRCSYQGEWKEAVQRSLITLKALTHAPTGGITAAATTSLPEKIGGVRNWDYRFCWLRDATFTLYAFLVSGYHEEARDWQRWLLRAVAGQAAQLNIVYGLAGERRLNELTLDWLPGYENSSPVRTGNAAWKQFQLDVFGEVLDVLHLARREGLEATDDSWRVELELLAFLEAHWDDPDEGIWEVRGPRRQFTHSKVMAWVAFDRAVKDCERFKLEGNIQRWRELRDKIHVNVCQKAFDAKLNAFVQYYGSQTLDASLLMMAPVGFLAENDARMRGTVEAIERHLTTNGFVARYAPASDIDGLPPGEGAFLPCTFWLADNYALQGRYDEARQVFERLLEIRNDVGLLSEEYDPVDKRLIGNFPQAFSHVGLINTAHNLAQNHGPAWHRQAN